MSVKNQDHNVTASMYCIEFLQDIHNNHLAYIDGLAQDCSNSSALAMELLQSYANPLI